MKKVTSIVLALVMAFSLASCTALGRVGKRKTTPTPTPTTTPTTTATPTPTPAARARAGTGSTDVPGNTPGGGFGASGEIAID